TFLILILTLFGFIVFFFNITSIPAFQVKNPKPMGNDAILNEEDEDSLFSSYTDDKDNWPEITTKDPIVTDSAPTKVKEPEPIAQKLVGEINLDFEKTEPVKKDIKTEPVFTVEET